MSVKAYNQAFGGNPNSRNYRPGRDAVATREGGLAYGLDVLEAVTQLVMLGLIGSSYYDSEKEQLKRAKQTWENAIGQASADPAAAEYLAKLVSYGREVGGMKFQPVLGLVYLSTLEDKQWFCRAFPHVIKTPKDAHDFMDLARKANIRTGLGRSIKRVLQEYINGLSTYHVRRYTGKLRDIITVCHPAAIQGTLPDKHISYIMRGDAADILELQAMQAVRDALSKGNTSDGVIALINRFGMQLEELKSTFGGLSKSQLRDVYTAMVPRLSITALMQNLVTIEWVFSSNERDGYSAPNCGYLRHMIGVVEERLQDVEAYKRSRVLPFTPLMAAKMTHVPEWQAALYKLVEQGCTTMFDPAKLTGKSIRINVDTSGSMRGQIMSGKLNGPNINIAEFVGVMGSALYQAMGDNCSIWAIASGYKRVPVRTLSAVGLGEEIMHTEVGHGTFFEQCITGEVRVNSSQYDYRVFTQTVPEAKYQGENVYILLTDGQQADNLEKAWAQARKPHGAKLIIWDVCDYGNRISNREDVLYLRGYSSQMIDVVRKIMEDDTDQMKIIGDYSL